MCAGTIQKKMPIAFSQMPISFINALKVVFQCPQIRYDMAKTTFRFIVFLLVYLATMTLQAQAPNWMWAKNIGLYYNSKIDVTAVDNEGNIYITGDFNTATTSIDDVTLTNNSDPNMSDAYIFKFSPTGNMLWHRQISTNKYEYIFSLDTDSA